MDAFVNELYVTFDEVGSNSSAEDSEKENTMHDYSGYVVSPSKE